MRYRVTVVGVWAMVALSGGSAQAQDATPPVAFADDKAVTGTCAELAEGVEIEIWNETGAQQPVTIDFEPRNGAEASAFKDEACGGLTLEKPENLKPEAGQASGLRPGEGATLKLSASDGDDAEAYSGALVIYGNGTRVARKKITITEPAQSRTLEAVPETEKVEAKFTTSEEGLLWVAVEAKEPGHAADGKGSKPVTLGALSGPGGPVAVVWRGEAEPVEGSVNPKISKLGLEPEGDLEPGTYSGNVDLAPNDEEKGTVALEVKVKKGLGWVLGLLFAGIVLGALLTYANAGVLPAARLRGRVAALTGRHRKAVADLQKEAPEGSEEEALPGKEASKHWSEIEIGDLRALQTSLRERIDEAKNKTLISIDKTLVTNLDAEITAIEQQIDLLKKIPPFAREVEKALQLPRAVRLPPPRGDQAAAPKRETKAKEAIKGRQLKAEKVKAQIEKMEVAAEEVQQLRTMEAELETLWIATAKLSEGDDKKDLVADLGDIREQLWDLESATEQEAVAKQMRAANQKLARLKADGEGVLARSAFLLGMRGMRGGEDLIALEEFGAPPSEDAEARERILTAVFAAAAKPAAPAAAVKDVAPAPMDEDAAKGVLDTAMAVQFAIIAVSALLALATGLKAVYGDTWGTPLDLLVAFTWGAVGQALVSNLTTAIDDWGGLRWLRRG